jgi:hypothetical protein
VLFAPKSLKVEYQGSQNTMVIGMWFDLSMSYGLGYLFHHYTNNK